jgi:hypothetical protein
VPKLALFLLATLAALGADDPWAKVRQLKTGSELRIFRKGAVQPTLAKFGDVVEDALIVIVKNAQTSIPKDSIERIESRPSKIVKRVDGGLSAETKPYETVYRRQPNEEKKP